MAAHSHTTWDKYYNVQYGFWYKLVSKIMGERLACSWLTSTEGNDLEIIILKDCCVRDL